MNVWPVACRTIHETFEDTVNAVMNAAREKAGKTALNSLKYTNNVVMMSLAGSKGSNLNISQMVACCAQQNVEGKRIPFGFTQRTLPHFAKDDFGPESKCVFSSQPVQVQLSWGYNFMSCHDELPAVPDDPAILYILSGTRYSSSDVVLFFRWSTPADILLGATIRCIRIRGSAQTGIPRVNCTLQFCFEERLQSQRLLDQK
jgi:hypothetical protein